MFIAPIHVPEVWLPVTGYEGFYEVSNLGQVRRALDAPDTPGTWPGRLLKPVMSCRYLIVSLSTMNVAITHRVHRLVLEAFCGPEPFEGAHAAHNNGDPANCQLRNLRWATPIENQADIDRHGTRIRGEAVVGAVLTEADVRTIRERISAGERNNHIAADFGVSISTVSLIRRNKIWRHVA